MSLALQIGRPKIAEIVDTFYSRIQHHPTLAQPFSQVPDWPLHKERLSYFWWVVLGGERDRPDIRYDVSTKHFAQGFNRALLADWLALFRATLDELLPAPEAAAWIELAQRMGDGLAEANDQMLLRTATAVPVPIHHP